MHRAGPSEAFLLSYSDLHPGIHVLQANHLVQNAADGRLHCTARWDHLLLQWRCDRYMAAGIILFHIEKIIPKPCMPQYYTRFKAGKSILSCCSSAVLCLSLNFSAAADKSNGCMRMPETQVLLSFTTRWFVVSSRNCRRISRVWLCIKPCDSWSNL